MRKTWAVCLLGWMLAGSAWARDAGHGEHRELPSTREMCRVQACQHGLHVTLKARDGSTYDHVFDTYPAVVQPFGIVVLAGQTVHVEAELSQGRLLNLVAVGRVTHPDRTISATLTQGDDGGMLLKVSNPFPGWLKFSMGMMPLDRPQLLKTSSCPIPGTGTNFESWPYPIFQVVLGDGRVMADKAGPSCND